jgi:hypothetical protein
MNRQEKEEFKARQKAISEAVQEEMIAVTEAIAEGGIAIIETFCGRYQLDCVNSDWWYITHPEGQKADSFNRRSWAGCNDGTWDSIMKQLGLERHPRFKNSTCDFCGKVSSKFYQVVDDKACPTCAQSYNRTHSR